MEAHTWKAIQSKGVLPPIQTPKDYETATFEGIKAATIWLLEGNPKPPTLRTAKKIHRLAFQHATPFAGKPTTKQLITNGFVTCEPQRIELEFEILQEQFQAGLPSNANPQEICRWTAFAAARWLRIHPFLDGNKRTISLWTLATIQQKIGGLTPDVKVYHQLQNDIKALRKGNLQPFGEHLLKATGLSYGKEAELNWNPPHKIAPTFTELTQEK